jgi:hypothetical protein
MCLLLLVLLLLWLLLMWYANKEQHVELYSWVSTITVARPCTSRLLAVPFAWAAVPPVVLRPCC